MAPGGFSLTLLIPFLRRRSKKYEKLETEEPEKKKQEAALDELARINHKIDRLVSTMRKEDFETPSGPEDECLGCGECRAVMQVSPCGHQALCRLCFVKNIQQAVSSRQLPLCCVICHCKVQRVKNNYKGTSLSNRRPLPSSVSGYELSSLSKSASNYSVHSASSCGSNRSVRSSASVRSLSSIKSNGSSSSWFSVNSLSSFQCTSLEKGANTKPRPHSLTGPSRHRLSYTKSLPQSLSSPAIRSLGEKPNLRAKVPPSSQSAHNLSGYLNSPPPQPPKTITPPISPPPASTSPDQLVPPSQAGKGVRRVVGKENHYSRKKVKSPDLLETTFTMSTIEEEMEGVNIGNTLSQDRG